jgi:hypothetical protein
MSIPEMIGYVLAGTQFLKTALGKPPFNAKVEKAAAVVASVIVAVAVVFYKYQAAGLGFQLVPMFTDFVQVVIGANMSYGLLKVARAACPSDY